MSNLNITKYFSCCIALTLFHVQAIYSITFGSDTAPTRFNTQQQVRNSDLIAGFAAMAGGFAFFDTADTATFDSFFGISGLTGLNGGKLVLFRDLVIQDEGYFQNIGNIEGNGHTISFAPNMKTFPLLPPSNCAMNFVSSTTSISALNSAAWSFDNRFLAVTGDTQLSIYSFSNINDSLSTVVTVNSPGGSTTLSQPVWHPFLYRLAVSSGGNPGYITMYTFDSNLSTLSSNYTVTTDVSLSVRSIAWHPSSLYLAAAIGSPGQVVVYPVNSNNTLDEAHTFTQPSLPNVITIDWNSTGSYLGAIGIAALSLLQFSPLPTISFPSIVAPTGVVGAGLSWNKTSSSIFAASGTPSPQIRVYQFTPPNVSLLASAINVGSSPRVSWGSGSCFEVNWGTGATSGVSIYSIDLLATNSLKQVSGFSQAATPGSNVAYNGSYMAVPEGSNILLYKNVNFGPPPQFVFSDVNILLNNNTFFNNSNIVFRGSCSINGNNNIFSFSPTSLIKVDTASSLRLSNIIIEAIRNGKISCTDSSSTITFSNSIMQFDTSFSFTAGRIDVLGTLKLTGSSASFDYRTTESFTILSNSALIVDSGITLSYSPNNLSTSLLQFVNDTSELILQGGNLVASATGLGLTKGRLVVDSASSLRSIARASAQGIVFGNGVSSANNMKIAIKPAASLSCNGFIVDNNV